MSKTGWGIVIATLAIAWAAFAVTGVMKLTQLRLPPILGILIPNLIVLTFGLAVISIARAVDKRPWI